MNYIGITNNIDKRKAEHVRIITDLVWDMRNRKECVACRIPAHKIIAKLLSRRLSKKYIYSEVSFKIIDIFDNPYIAGKCEGRNILLETRKGFNLNSQKKSKYVSNKNFVIMHPIRKKQRTNRGIILYQDGKSKYFSFNQ